MNKKKYYKPRTKAELSLQFWWNKKTGCWNLLVTKNKKNHNFCLFGDPYLFGKNLANNINLTENDKLFLDRVFIHYLETRKRNE